MSDLSAQQIAGETVMVLGALLLVGWVFWLYSRNRQKALRERIEFQTRVLARFESSRELDAFLQTPGGRALLGERHGAPAALTRILTAVQLGIFFAVIGSGILALAFLLGEVEVAIPGVILGTAGIGFCLSAGFSYWFSKRLGLLDRGGPRNRVEIEP